MCGLIVRVRVVPRRTVVGDIDRRFDNLSRSHHQSHVNCVSSVYSIYVSGQLSRDVIGCDVMLLALYERKNVQSQSPSCLVIKMATQ